MATRLVPGEPRHDAATARDPGAPWRLPRAAVVWEFTSHLLFGAALEWSRRGVRRVLAVRSCAASAALRSGASSALVEVGSSKPRPPSDDHQGGPGGTDNGLVRSALAPPRCGVQRIPAARFHTALSAPAVSRTSTRRAGLHGTTLPNSTRPHSGLVEALEAARRGAPARRHDLARPAALQLRRAERGEGLGRPRCGRRPLGHLRTCEGLLGGRELIVLAARGGGYAPGSPRDG